MLGAGLFLLGDLTAPGPRRALGGAAGPDRRRRGRGADHAALAADGRRRAVGPDGTAPGAPYRSGVCGHAGAHAERPRAGPPVSRPAAGGGRWVSVGPERLQTLAGRLRRAPRAGDPHRRRDRCAPGGRGRQHRRGRGALPAAVRRPGRARPARPARGRAARAPRRLRLRRVRRAAAGRLEGDRAAGARPVGGGRSVAAALRPAPRGPGPGRAAGRRRHGRARAPAGGRVAGRCRHRRRADGGRRACWPTGACRRCARWSPAGCSTSPTRARPCSRRPTTGCAPCGSGWSTPEPGLPAP